MNHFIFIMVFISFCYTIIPPPFSHTTTFLLSQSTIYRRDGKPMSLSVHMFPVFDSSRDAFYPDTGTGYIIVLNVYSSSMLH